MNMAGLPSSLNKENVSILIIEINNYTKSLKKVLGSNLLKAPIFGMPIQHLMKNGANSI